MSDGGSIFESMNDIDIEKSIIVSYFSDDSVRDRIATHLASDMFSNPDVQNIVSLIQDYAKQNEGRFPRKIDELVLYSASQGKKEIAISALKSIRDYSIATSKSFPDKKMTLNAFEQFIRRAGTQNIFFKKLAVSRDSGTWDKFLPEVARLSTFKIQDNLGSFYDDQADSFISKMTSNSSANSTFLDFINRNARGGSHPGEMTVWLAAQGVGKSWMLYKNAQHVYKNLNKDTLVITLELPEQSVKERLSVMGTGMSVEQLTALKEQHGENWLSGFILDRSSPVTSPSGKKARLRVIGRAPGRYSGSDLEADLKSLDREGFNPEQIAVDYLTIMKSPSGLYGGGSDMYLSGKYLSEELRAIAVNYKVPIDTAAQLSRSAYGNLDAGHESVGISRAITETADCMIYMTENELLRSMMKRKLAMRKNRNGPTDIEMYIHTDFSCGDIRELNEEEDRDISNKMAAFKEKTKSNTTTW